MAASEVLIVGAGPTGLVLALGLARRGIPFRIIDKNPGPGLASRAMAVQARTLEFYRQLGFAEDAVGRGIKMEALHLRAAGREAVTLRLADLGRELSPYPFALCLPQDDHERFLVERLEAAGVAVEWGCELKELSQDETRVRAVLAAGGSREVVKVAYLCGCDGARSLVRQSLGVDFPGGTYDHFFYVADVAIAGGFQRDIVANLAATGFGLMFPVRDRGMQRLIGIVPDALAHTPELTFEHVRPTAEPLLGVRVQAVNWFSTYHVHHRVAARFRVRRCFLAGDAGHIHSPAGGQGMNTGIGDAFNLAWKLADVLRGRAAPALLDTFESERIAFARTLVATTDRAFQGLVGRGLGNRLLRARLIPTLLPTLTRLAAVRRTIFKTVSQTRIAYRDSALSEGRVGAVHGGDRLPWVPIAEGDNFAPLRSLDWQLHVYGGARHGLRDAATALGFALYTFPWSMPAGRAGLRRDAAYLIRPDGHVALALPTQEPDRLRAYVTRQRLVLPGRSVAGADRRSPADPERSRPAGDPTASPDASIARAAPSRAASNASPRPRRAVSPPSTGDGGP